MQQADSPVEYQAMLLSLDKLVVALSNPGILSISQKLFANGIISEETYEKILLPCATPQEKATILVNNVLKMIKINPISFPQFITILSEEQWTKDIVEIIQSTLRDIAQNAHPHPLGKCVDGNERALPTQFVHYLRTRYTSLTPAQLSDDQWPPSATRRVFNLAMIKTTKIRRQKIKDDYVRQTITGKTDDILYEKEPIELKDILQKSEQKRKVVLLEGAPGCGKSTLSVFIAQQWGEGELFTEYQLVILITLRDPAVQEAKSIADLIPSPDSTTAQEIETKIFANNCRDVLFILDGWDELPSNLKRNSLFHHFIQPNLLRRNPIHESAVIVTSRPIASGDHHQFVSTRVEILGFTPKEIDEYFVECLKGDTDGLQTLKERIDQNPAVASSCYLPLNANILVHLFLSLSNTLPTTQFEIFSQFILHCIYRHQIKFAESQEPLESLDDLPEGIREPFQFLCELAYKGVVDNRIVFSSKDVPNKSNLLGLIQGVVSLAKGKVVSYHFLHLSVQELLAALHIAKNMSESEQVSLFEQQWTDSHFIAMFQYYAAITKLKASGIQDIIIKHCQDKRLLSYILNCLREAQNPSLCVTLANEMDHKLDFTENIILTPLDCFSIGVFLSCICTSEMPDKEFAVDLSESKIGHHGSKYLVSGLQNGLDEDSTVTTLLNLELPRSGIGDHELSSFLKIGCFKYLIMNSVHSRITSKSTETYDSDDNDSDIDDRSRKRDRPKLNTISIHEACAQHLRENTTLKRLSMWECGITPSSAKYLAEGLAKNRYMEELDISCNDILDEGIQHIAQALRVNQSLRRLTSFNCGITDMGLEQLAMSLVHNKTLVELILEAGARSELFSGTRNHFTDQIAPVVSDSLKLNLTLTKLELDFDPLDSSGYYFIKETVNSEREIRGIPCIKVQKSTQILIINFANFSVSQDMCKISYN